MSLNFVIVELPTWDMQNIFDRQPVQSFSPRSIDSIRALDKLLQEGWHVVACVSDGRRLIYTIHKSSALK